MRRSSIGFLIGAGTCLIYDLVMLATQQLHHASVGALIAWWTVNAPSIPIVWLFAIATPMGMGAPGEDITPWDYTAVTISVCTASIVYGLVGGAIGWWMDRKRGAAGSIA